jgi:NTP pyrophosphatase (non-canonical NTP hydrolase)
MITQTHPLNLPHSARTYRVLDEVAAERARQYALLRTGRIQHDCADPSVNLDRKLRVLTEELGEVAQAIDILEQCGGPAEPLCREELREELIQVAAVAVAWAESLTPNCEPQKNAKNAKQEDSAISAFSAVKFPTP